MNEGVRACECMCVSETKIYRLDMCVNAYTCVCVYIIQLCTKCIKFSKQNELSNMRTELYICTYLDARLYRPIGGWTFLFFVFVFVVV